MTQKSKRLGTFIWAVLECMFFSSIVLGWTWLGMVFRKDGYFLESSCNLTEVNVTLRDTRETTTDAQTRDGDRPWKTSGQRKPINPPCRPRRGVKLKSNGLDTDLDLYFDLRVDSRIRRARSDQLDALSRTAVRFQTSPRHQTSSPSTTPVLPVDNVLPMDTVMHIVPNITVMTTRITTSKTTEPFVNQDYGSIGRTAGPRLTSSTSHDSRVHLVTKKYNRRFGYTNDNVDNNYDDDIENGMNDIISENNNNNNDNNYNNFIHLPSNMRADTLTTRTITRPSNDDYNMDANLEDVGDDNDSLVDDDTDDKGDMTRNRRNDTQTYYGQPSVAARSGGKDTADDFRKYRLEKRVVGYCYEQNEKIQTMFAVVILLRDLFVFPICYVYDKYGTTRTRLLTVLVFALGTLTMTFTSSSFPWLVIPALTLEGLAGSAVFLTNLQTANLFGRKRHIVMSAYVGAAYSNGIITLLMKVVHFNGKDIQTSFMILTIAIVPILVSTVAFLPKTRIPWPLPADYGKRRNQSLDEAMLRKQRAWQRRMSDVEFDMESPFYGSTEAGLVRSRRPAPQFTPVATQSLFVWSVLWYSCQRLQEAIFEGRLVDIAPDPLDDNLDINMETYFSSIQLTAVVLAPLAGLLIDRDPRPALGLTPATQQMHRIVPAIVITSIIGFLEVITDMVSGPGARGITILFNILHKVFTLTTMCAFLMHLHFNHQNLGKLYGLTVSLSAVIAAFQFPVRTYLIKKYNDMFPAHILLIILNIVALAHAVNAWDHCRKRLIKDQSDNSTERFSRLKKSGNTPTTIHIETDDRNLPGNHGDRLSVCDQNEASTTEVSGLHSSHNASSDEKATTSETLGMVAPDDSNGGSRIIFSSGFRDDDDDDDDEVYDDDDMLDDINRGYNGLHTIDFV